MLVHYILESSLELRTFFTYKHIIYNNPLKFLPVKTVILMGIVKTFRSFVRSVIRCVISSDINSRGSNRPVCRLQPGVDISTIYIPDIIWTDLRSVEGRRDNVLWISRECLRKEFYCRKGIVGNFLFMTNFSPEGLTAINKFVIISLQAFNYN